MDNNKNLEEANKEIEKSKTILHNLENPDKKDSEAKDDESAAEKPKGSGIFTVDGKELPEIEGGYDIINPGGTLSDDEFVSY